jgi:hypothetical protein
LAEKQYDPGEQQSDVLGLVIVGAIVTNEVGEKAVLTKYSWFGGQIVD